MTITRLFLIPVILCIIIPLAVACDYKSLEASSPTFEKQPEPRTPVIAGAFSGLNSEELGIIDVVYDKTGNSIMGASRDNGPWELVIAGAREGEYYTVTAEAEGYTVQPGIYRVYIEDEKAYTVNDGEIGKEALHLDFQFVPKDHQ